MLPWGEGGPVRSGPLLREARDLFTPSHFLTQSVYWILVAMYNRYTRVHVHSRLIKFQTIQMYLRLVVTHWQIYVCYQGFHNLHVVHCNRDNILRQTQPSITWNTTFIPVIVVRVQFDTNGQRLQFSKFILHIINDMLPLPNKNINILCSTIKLHVMLLKTWCMDW